MNQDEVNRFMTHYYEHGSPDEAVEVIDVFYSNYMLSPNF